jgi:hypothetical protein
MKKAIRIALGSAVLAGGLAVVGASPANAQVRIGGSFPLPHGRISVSIGDVGFPIGGYVPDGYSVYDNPEYGYGFEYGDQWIPCEQYGTRWVISASPISFGHRDYGYGRTYRNDTSSYSRDYRRYDNRSYDTRAYGSRSHNTRSDDSRSYGNRNSGRTDRQVWDNRSSQRDNQRSRDQNRRSRW